MLRSTICLLAFACCFALEAQAQEVPNSREPGTQQVVHSPKMARAKAVKRKRQRAQDTPEYEFYERVERAAKEKQRIVKYLHKRQFKDHRYFGHKKIPKRRPPHKMRYCNECGVRH